MRGRNNGDLSFAEQLFVIQPGEVVDGPVHDRDVRAAVTEHDGLFSDLAENDLRGGCLGSCFDRAEKPLKDLVGSAGLRREHERALGPARSLRTPGRGCHGIQRGAGFTKQHKPRVGERDAASISVEQPHPETLLELSDRARQRWLRHTQKICCASEVQLFRDSDEVAELPGLQIKHGFTLRPDTC